MHEILPRRGKGEIIEEERGSCTVWRGRQHGLCREPTPPRFPWGGESLALQVWALNPTPMAPKDREREKGGGERERREGGEIHMHIFSLLFIYYFWFLL